MAFQNLSVDIDTLPMLRDTAHQAHPESFLTELLVLAGLRLVAVLTAPVLLYLFDRLIFAQITFGLWVILSILSILSVYKSFSIRGYALRTLDISYKKGWIFYSHLTIPFTRVQHSEISQGPIDRLFGLVTLNIYTAGGSSSDLSIPGLHREEAQRLRDFISSYHE